MKIVLFSIITLSHCFVFQYKEEKVKGKRQSNDNHSLISSLMEYNIHEPFFFRRLQLV